MKEGLVDIQTEEEEISQEKKFLLNEFDKYGYSKNTLISKSEISLFLDRKSSNNKFDINLSERIFEFLGLDDLSTISVSKFVSGFLLFYENLIKNKDDLAEEIIDDIININKYDENIKICGEICDMKFNIDSNEIKDLIIKITYNGNEKELKGNIVETNNNNENIFKFNYLSPNNSMKFVLLTKNNTGNLTEIGSNSYSFGKMINSEEQFITQIEIPFKEDKENIAVLLTLKMSILKNYFKKKKLLKSRKEPKDNNIHKADDKINSKNDKKENEKEKNNIKGLSKKTFEFPKDKYIIKFNNEHTFDKTEKKLYLYYNNEKIKFEKKDSVKKDADKKEKIDEKKIVDDTKNNALIKKSNDNNNLINNNSNLNYNNNDINKDSNKIYNYNYNAQNEIINFNNQENNSIYNNFNDIYSQNNDNIIVQENTLPIKYMPPIVSEVNYNSFENNNNIYYSNNPYEIYNSNNLNQYYY